MRADNHEYFAIQNGQMVQTTYRLKTEKMYIDLVKYYYAEGWDIPEPLEARANLALNRLIHNEAQNAAQYHR